MSRRSQSIQIDTHTHTRKQLLTFLPSLEHELSSQTSAMTHNEYINHIQRDNNCTDNHSKDKILTKPPMLMRTRLASGELLSIIVGLTHADLRTIASAAIYFSTFAVERRSRRLSSRKNVR